jgi:hypothetical protein
MKAPPFERAQNALNDARKEILSLGKLIAKSERDGKRMMRQECIDEYLARVIAAMVVNDESQSVSNDGTIDRP